MVRFVSEVSSNHKQDMDRCLEFIDTSKKIGCDAVKFQLFKIEELFAPEILSKSQSHRNRKKWELPVSFLPDLAQRTHENKMQFSCTPFYLKAVSELYPYVDFYKISSYELLWADLLAECAQTRKPVVLATGMATLNEIRSAVDILQSHNCSDITVLHCVSSYPALPQECNLKAVETIHNQLGVKTGWSDHSVNPKVISRAVCRFNASMVEFHLDIDGKGDEYKTGHCWLPHEIQKTIVAIENLGADDWALADGTGIKAPCASEQADILWRADPSDGLRPFKSQRN